jgi:hypothetical protein
MIETRSPLSWKLPDWHADYGDAKGELEHLRSLAEAVLSSNPQSRAELIVPEPGLMYLELASSGGAPAQAFSICEAKAVGKRRYALFLFPGTSLEQELYADSIDEAVEILGGQWGSRNGDEASIGEQKPVRS